MHQPDENQIKIYKQAAAFAAEYIACRPDLQTGQEFPMDIWRKMGEAGLFQTGIAEIYGGTGGGYLDLLKGGEAFVQSGYNLGLALSWLYQQIIAHYVINIFGTSQQRRQYLCAAAAGKITFSFAVSEPGHGSRPKLLTTKYQTRFAKNRNRLFTFLDHDGVPWKAGDCLLSHIVLFVMKLRR